MERWTLAGPRPPPRSTLRESARVAEVRPTAPHFVGNGNTAAFMRSTPAWSALLAIDLGSRDAASPRLAPIRETLALSVARRRRTDATG